MLRRTGCAIALGIAAAMCGGGIAAQPASSAETAASDPFAGVFRSDELTMTLRREGGGYTGTFRAKDQAYPLAASAENGRLSGSFTAAGEAFPFTGTIDGGILKVSTGGKDYALKKDVAPAATMTVTPTPRPASPPPIPSEPLNFQVVTMLPSGGRTVYATAPGAKSARGLLLRTRDTMTPSFGAVPRLQNAFGDEKDLRAGAPFDGVFQGTPVKGMIFAGIGELGGSVTVAFDRAEIAAQTVPQLLQQYRPGVQGSQGAQPAPIALNWQNVSLPDGSGSMRLPEGWRITGAANGAVDVVGPAGQAVELGLAFPVNSPQAEQAWLQSMAGAGMAPTPSGSMVVPYSADPVQAFQLFVPVYADFMSSRYGTAPFRLTQIIEASPFQFSTGAAAFIHYAGQSSSPQGMHNFRGLALAAPSVIGEGKWLMYFSYVAAPEEIFARDLQLMLQIWSSWKVSDQLLQQRLRQASETMRSINEIITRPSPSADRAAATGGDATEKAADDFSEMIRGYRTVEDANTGERREVDYGNVDKIVEKMNEHEGFDRYKQIPLRDQ